VVIFDCNGVLVDSETLAAQVLSEQFVRAGFGRPEILRQVAPRCDLDSLEDVRRTPVGEIARDNVRRQRRTRGDPGALPRGVACDALCRAGAVLDSWAEMRGVVFELGSIWATLETADLVQLARIPLS
jgi:beta-phosphoglucomutase-like phosphatase (HAD superfamily)